MSVTLRNLRGSQSAYTILARAAKLAPPGRLFTPVTAHTSYAPRCLLLSVTNARFFVTPCGSGGCILFMRTQHAQCRCQPTLGRHKPLILNTQGKLQLALHS